MRGECSYTKENGKIMYLTVKENRHSKTGHIIKAHFKMV